MRRVYLIRHGQPDFPDDEKYCLGRTDMPLGALGALQACQLAEFLGGARVSRVYASSLSRARETAAFLSDDYTVLPGLEEMYAGAWDGLSFSEIRAGWPELFAARAERFDIPIPGSEDMQEGRRRFSAAVEAALGGSAGDIAIVSHTTVIQSMLAGISGRDIYESARIKQPYCSYYELHWDSGFETPGDYILPALPLDRKLAGKLLAAAGVPGRVASHSRAVARQAELICAELTAAGLTLDAELVYCAALLHDIARARPAHPAVAASWLEALGYGDAARLVAAHHDLGEPRLDEAAVLYIADKCVEEDAVIPIARRYENSLARCASDEAKQAHARRAAEAAAVQNLINSFCGKEVIL